MSADRLDAKRPHAKRRTYNTRLIKRDYAYFISEIADLLKLHRNAVRRWLKSGLPTIDDRKPALVYGADLIAYLDSRQASRKQKCEANEFYCCRCRRPQPPRQNRVEVQIHNRQKLNLSAVCRSCGARMNRAGSVQRIDE
jgi:tRNA(Ile)-lysidine synthase TilS/MesJ